MLIYRYITKEIIISFFATVFILLFVALSNHFAYLLTGAAAGQISLELAFKILALYIPEFFSYITPLALFIAILLSLSRMYADSEMVVLFSCGFKWSNIIKPILFVASLLFVLILIFTTWIVPKTVVIRDKALEESEAIGVIQAITPGKFQTLSDGKIVFYVEDKDRKNNLEKVFIAEQPSDESKPWTIITSDKANVRQKANSENFYLILTNGQRYTGIPGNKDYTRITFNEYGREIIKEKDSQSNLDNVRPTMELFYSKNNADKAEFQWRLAIPISILIMSLIAIPLSKVNPRQGRFAKLVPAIVVYIIYFNLITFSKRWIALGKLPSAIGTWWVHIVFLLIGIFLILKESGKLYSIYYYWNKKAN